MSYPVEKFQPDKLVNKMERNFKFKSNYFTSRTADILVDFQTCFCSFTMPVLWLPDGEIPVAAGFCLRLLNEAKEEIGTAEFKITGRERFLHGKKARAYSLERLGPPDMESSLPTISLSTLAIPQRELI